MYTVKEVSELSNVTIKTLHHYHKIGLLMPREITEAGYRLYGMEELERLQHILFYKELDFPLEQIKQLLEDQPGRAEILSGQRELLLGRMSRLERLVHTLDESIQHTREGKAMNTKDMFQGFQSEEEWKEALAEQNRHVQENYGYDMLEENRVDPVEMNEQAAEAVRFMNGMAQALKDGVKYDDGQIRQLIASHLEALKKHGHDTGPDAFAAQARFFLQDDFHRNMLESQQTGLSYYLCTAAEAFAQNT
ncbi:MerR family transcriptional regulator [Paenibacillus sp. OAE614]|uniref:MerR family transcriptional regulator n=1 Tax=Paenibacillus sp. OAE614 TaxID=2663804 RepID=UPI0019E9A229